MTVEKIKEIMTKGRFGSEIRVSIWPHPSFNFRSLFDERASKDKLTFESLFRIYSGLYMHLFIKGLEENLTNFVNGYRFWNDELLTEKGERITENSSDKDIINALVKLLKEQKTKADLLVLEYIKKIEGNEESTNEDFMNDFTRKFDEFQKQTMKRFDNVDKKIDKQTENQQEWEKHHLAVTWKAENKKLFTAIGKLIKNQHIEYIKCKFNFKMDKGCMGEVFRTFGYNNYKAVYQYLLVNGKPVKLTTLRNCTKNRTPNQWEEILAAIKAE